MFRLILNRCKSKHFQSFKALSILTALWRAKKRSVAKNSRRKDYIVRNVQKSNVRLLISIIFICVTTFSNAQSVELSAGFNRLDYQAGVGYGHRWNHFHLTSKLEFAVTSTFAQRRIMPRVSVGSSYFFLRKGLVDFGPEITYAYSRQKLTQHGKTAHHWNEIYAGYRLQIGRVIKFVHSASGGWINESFYSSGVNKSVNFNSLGIYAQIGVSYTF